MNRLRLIILAASLPTVVLAQQGDRDGHDNMESIVPADKIPAAPVLPVAEALKTIRAQQGFVVEAYAAEPLVDKPVTMDYDRAGRLWICEMVGYMPDIDGK